MHYNETKEKSAEYLRLALKFMGEYGIPVNPVNYLVWYEYVAGSNRKLTQGIDRLRKEARPFTPELNHGLYRRFIVSEKKLKSEKVLHELQRLLKEMPGYVGMAAGDVSRGSSLLSGYARFLDDETDINEIRQVVDAIVAETRRLAAVGDSLKARLASSTQEIDKLRSDLAEIKGQATTDTLTGLPNRLAFDITLASEIERAEVGSGLSLLFADIDHFKMVNDSFGHLVGDMMLKMTAETIRQFIKGKDFAARFGGEEFVVLLPDTPMKGALRVAESIRSHFESKKWTRRDTGESIGSITLSFGVAQYLGGETAEALIQRADGALYASKASGRNRVTEGR